MLSIWNFCIFYSRFEVYVIEHTGNCAHPAMYKSFDISNAFILVLTVLQDAFSEKFFSTISFVISFFSTLRWAQVKSTETLFFSCIRLLHLPSRRFGSWQHVYQRIVIKRKWQVQYLAINRYICSLSFIPFLSIHSKHEKLTQVFGMMHASK